MSTGQNQDFNDYPQQLRSSVEHPELHYVQQSGYYAVHNLQSDAEAAGAVTTFNDGTIAIFAGPPETARNLAPNATVGPVYALQPGGALAVPTGLVFLRFAEGESAAAHASEIQAAGYTVDQIPVYAPHTAWVRSQSIATSLAGISRLETLPKVENVEPQMLMQRAQR